MPIIKQCTLARGTQPTDEIINNLLTSLARKEQVRYYNTLKDYFSSVNVTSRPAPHEVKVVANNARYITKTNVGYLLGNPVQYLVSEGLNIDLIVDNYKKQTISNLDVELATDVSVYGHAFERVYTNELAEPWSTRVNPSNIILAYDNSVQHNKLFAVIYNPVFDDKGKQLENEFDVTILTPELCMERNLKDGHLFQIPEIEDFMHGYGEVPVIEYMNSSDRMGDFEPVISLLDAYNILQSDRVIDRERLVDAILAFYGMNITTEQKGYIGDRKHLIPIIKKMEEYDGVTQKISQIYKKDEIKEVFLGYPTKKSAILFNVSKKTKIFFIKKYALHMDNSGHFTGKGYGPNGHNDKRPLSMEELSTAISIIKTAKKDEVIKGDIVRKAQRYFIVRKTTGLQLINVEVAINNNGRMNIVSIYNTTKKYVDKLRRKYEQ